MIRRPNMPKIPVVDDHLHRRIRCSDLPELCHRPIRRGVVDEQVLEGDIAAVGDRSPDSIAERPDVSLLVVAWSQDRDVYRLIHGRLWSCSIWSSKCPDPCLREMPDGPRNAHGEVVASRKSRIFLP